MANLERHARAVDRDRHQLHGYQQLCRAKWPVLRLHADDCRLQPRRAVGCLVVLGRRRWHRACNLAMVQHEFRHPHGDGRTDTAVDPGSACHGHQRRRSRRHDLAGQQYFEDVAHQCQRHDQHTSRRNGMQLVSRMEPVQPCRRRRRFQRRRLDGSAVVPRLLGDHAAAGDLAWSGRRHVQYGVGDQLLQPHRLHAVLRRLQWRRQDRHPLGQDRQQRANPGPTPALAQQGRRHLRHVDQRRGAGWHAVRVPRPHRRFQRRRIG